MRAVRSEFKPAARARNLCAIVACMAFLPGTKRQAVEIGAIADEIARLRKDLRCPKCQPLLRAGAEADDVEAASCHGRLPFPGMRIIAK